jgi:branched-chain amino acid transport system permease protein
MEQALQIVIGGLVQGSVFAVVALGLSLVFRVTGVINLAQGGFCILAALLLHSFAATGWPMPLAVVAAIAITTLLGLALGAATFVPALARLPNSGMLMLSAGLLTAIEGFALVVWGSEPFAVPPFSANRPLDVGGLRIPAQGLWIGGAAALVVLGTWYLLQRTAAGRALRACAENATAARFCGVDVPRLTLLSFAGAAFIGAVGGVVVAPVLSLQFDAGRFFTNAGFIAVALGGMSSLAGAVAGGLFLGVAEQLAAGYVSSLYADALALGLLLATLLLRPQGLLRTGAARRSDVREEPRVHRAVLRLRGRGVRIAGIIGVVLLAALPLIVGRGSLLSALIIAFILFIAVLGLDVLMGYAGQVSLGQAGFMAIGGYTAAILATRYGVSPLIGTAAGIVLSLACAVMLSAATMRLRGAYLALATLAFGLLVDSLAVGLTDLTGGPSGLVGIPSLAIGPLRFDTPLSIYYLLLGVIVVLVVLLQGALSSDFGRALQAIRADQTAAAALGIDVPLHKMAAFAISAALASLAGSLYAFDFHFLAPEMVGTPRSFELIAMLVLGGEGLLVGGLPGAVLITLLPALFQPLAGYKILAEGAILVLVFQYLPEGLIGSLARRVATGRAAPAALARRLGEERAP